MGMHCDNVFKTFIEIVVKKGVFAPSELSLATRALTDKAEKEIAAGKRIDRRAPWLARVSGKGGPSHPEFENASLMEHLVSVSRGAAVFAEMDLQRHDPDLGQAEIERRLARIAAVGFMHDVDKILEVSRSAAITTEEIDGVLKRYRIDEFLAAFGASAPATWFQSMIDRAETSRSGRVMPGGIVLSASDAVDAQYVHLADRMDSILLRDGPRAALEELRAFTGLRTDVGRVGWRLIDIQQPLFPFLMDALLSEISAATVMLTGLPPLLETHHDGRLVAAVPEYCVDKIMKRALAGVQRGFRSDVRVSVNTRCYIDIYDAKATVDSLLTAMGEARLRQRTLALSTDLILPNAGLRIAIEEAAESVGFCFIWPNPDKVSGATLAPFPAEDDAASVSAFKHAAVLSIALRCKEPGDKSLAKRTLSALAREDELRHLLEDLGIEIPSDVLEISHDITRQSLIALLIGGMAAKDEEVFEAIFGDGALIMRWLDGDEEFAGINARIGDDVSEEYIAPVRDMLDAALEGRFIEGDEGAPYRCHFTNAPVRATDIYGSTAEGVYGLKVSAFSGRENRPENHRTSSAKGTWLSPLARAEHSLRFRLAPRPSDKTQMLISSPATSGLFASLTISNVDNELEVSAFEACTEDAKKVQIPNIGVDRFTRRLRVARFEAMPSKLTDSLDLIIRLVKTSIRTCRPLHVFQGLPHPVRDRLFFDALPREIDRGLGKSGFRIEEMPEVLRSLETWRSVADTNGLGARLATEIMDPATRLGGLCEAIVRIERMDNADLVTLKGTLSTQAKELIMNEQENPLVRYARAMTGYQRPTTHNDSQSVRERGMRQAIEAVTQAHGHGPMTRELIISAIIAQISNVAERESDNHFPKRQEGEPNFSIALSRAAEIFADEVWPAVFHNRLPNSRSRMHAIGVYRAAFDRAHQMRKAGEIVFPFS